MHDVTLNPVINKPIERSATRRPPGPTVEALVEAARLNFEAGRIDNAATMYRVLRERTTPPQTAVERVANGEACLFFARKALAQKRMGEATDYYREALDADPLATDYRLEMIIKVLLPMGLTEVARQEATRATKVSPGDARAWRTLGSTEQALNSPRGTKVAYERAVELDPDDPLNHLNLASYALDTGDYDHVREVCSVITERFPERHVGDVFHLLAMIEYREGRHESSVDLYDRAIAAGCYDPEITRWNRSLPLQSVGKYREGWADAEARGRQVTSSEFGIALRRFKAPLLDLATHSPPARVHLHEEMGYGDTIAMLRYVPLLAEMGYDVRVEVREHLVSLVQRSFPGIMVIERSANYPMAFRIPPFDYHHSLLSLPYVFGTEVNTVPWCGPYLLADQAVVARYRDRLEYVKRKKIGLAWSAGIRKGLWLTQYGTRKSMRFGQLRPLLDVDATFVSLQVGPEAAECDDSRVQRVLDEEPGSWDETAALVATLDLVITVDTSIAHLAGAMGKSVWLMMHTEGSWHWMVDRDNSPWYPSVKIYRQQRTHEWREVVARIAADLRDVF